VTRANLPALPGNVPPWRRGWFLARFSVAIIVATLSLTLIPSQRLDTTVAAGSPTPSAPLAPTTFVAPPATAPLGAGFAAFNIEPATLTAALEVRTAPSTTEPAGWVEPTVGPESEWTDAGHGVALPDVLLRIRFCESTNNYATTHTYSSASGAYQFLTGSWDWYGHADRYGVNRAHLATPAQQDEAALMTFQKDGVKPWAASQGCWGSANIDSRYLTAGPPATTTTTAAPTTTTPASSTTAAPATTTPATTAAPATTTTGAPAPTTSTPATTAPTTSQP